MYKFKKPLATKLIINKSYEANRIEERVAKLMRTNEPITDGAPLNYTERKDGVKPEYNIRTDRWELGVDGTDLITKSELTKREERHKPKMEVVKDENPGEGKAQSTDGTKSGDTAK